MSGCSKSDFEIRGKIGEGLCWMVFFTCSRFGEVYAADDRNTGKVVAIQKVRVTLEDKDIERESQILKECESPFIVKYHNAFQGDSELWVRDVCIA